MKGVDLPALRGAYVTLTWAANEASLNAKAHRDEATLMEARARDYRDMAEAAMAAYLALGGDPAHAGNWYSWTYLGTNEGKSS